MQKFLELSDLARNAENKIGQQNNFTKIILDFNVFRFWAKKSFPSYIGEAVSSIISISELSVYIQNS